MITNYKHGQSWTILDSNLNAVITGIENRKIIHLKIIDSEGKGLISHLPIDFSCFEKSIGKLVGQMDVNEVEINAIKTWQIDKGGVWDLGLTEVIEITFNTCDFGK